MRFLIPTVLLCTILSSVLGNTPLQLDNDVANGKHSHGEGESEVKVFSSNQRIRLPQNVIPDSYDLEIIPILDAGLPAGYEQFTAPGNVFIIVNCTKETSEIILHRHEILTVTRAEIEVKGVTDPDELFGVTPEDDLLQELLILKLNVSLQVGNQYSVFIPFVAPVDNTNRNNGLYLTKYLDPVTKEPNYVATTQFEAASARQAFPCFDEPALKAKFQLTIGYNKTEYLALTNTEPLDAEETPMPEIGAGWVKQKFNQTVPMSTYLVAITIANYEYEPAPDGLFDKPTGIYGNPHFMKNDAGESTGGVYSAAVQAKLLKIFQDRYEMDYKLNKLDSLAVTDFNFGAMENWGLNIYRQELLLFHEGESTEASRKSITSVLSHELAHQNFGNLVTCEFWDMIYLNEGFATYNEYLGASLVTNDAEEFQFAKIKLNEVLQVALAYDASGASHPLVNAADPNHPNDKLMVFFDRITYQKGGAVILMMEAFLGEDTFRRALVNYLKGMSFKAARQDDLFQYLTTQAHEEGKLSLDITMKDIMDTWTLQKGFPLIRVSRAGSSRIYISQEPFVNGGAVFQEPSDLDPNDLWHVPIAIASQDEPDFGNHTPKIWMEKDALLKSYGADTSKWVILNPDATGYYRVLYDTHLTNLIQDQITSDFTGISPFSRSQLIDDYFTFAEQKYIELETALHFTKYIASEPEMVVWRTVLTKLTPILNKLSGTSAAFVAFQQYILPRIEGGLVTVGKEQPAGQKGWKVILRSQLLDWACALQQTDCREYATRLFNEWDATDSKPIPVDIRPVAFCGYVSHGGFAAYEKVKNHYITAAAKDDHLSDALRIVLRNALACTQETSAADEMLEAALQGDATSFLKYDDRAVLLEKLAANANTRLALINFFRENIQPLIGALTEKSIAKVVLALSNYLGTEQEHMDISELIKAENDASWGESLVDVKNYINTIARNVAWRQEHDERLLEFFTNNKI